MKLKSKKNWEILTKPLGRENPITVQVLGVCSALAVTAKLQPAVVMGLAVVIVMGVSSFIISLMRNTIPSRVRIIVQLVVVASIVISVDQVLQAYMYSVSKQLSVFIGLIITNCILMGRLEAFALHRKPFQSLLDGMGNGMGYAIILILMGTIRELLGSGSLWGYKVIPESFYELGYLNNGLAILPPMALILVGAVIWIHRSKNKALQEH